MDLLANHNLPWAAYWLFMSDHIIVLDKIPGVGLVGLGETWSQNFAKFVLKVTGYEATHTCKDDQLYSGF